MSDKNSSSFPVRHYECDAYGHLNNITYVRYLHEAILASEAVTGHDLACYAALGRRWQTRRLTIDYLRPAQYGDTVAVAITSAVSDPTTIRRTGELRLVPTADLVAQAQVEAILLDTVTGQPMAIGPEIAVRWVATIHLTLCRRCHPSCRHRPASSSPGAA